MKRKRFTQDITIFVEPEMYQAVKQESDELEISLSEMVRIMVIMYFDDTWTSSDRVYGNC